MNPSEERSLEEWTKLRREVAMAEQQLASQTHELLREKAKVRDLEMQLLTEKDTGFAFRLSCLQRLKRDISDSDLPPIPRPSWHRWAFVAGYCLLCAAVLGVLVWIATRLA